MSRNEVRLGRRASFHDGIGRTDPHPAIDPASNIALATRATTSRASIVAKAPGALERRVVRRRLTCQWGQLCLVTAEAGSTTLSPLASTALSSIATRSAPEK